MSCLRSRPRCAEGEDRAVVERDRRRGKLVRAARLGQSEYRILDRVGTWLCCVG